MTIVKFVHDVLYSAILHNITYIFYKSSKFISTIRLRDLNNVKVTNLYPNDTIRSIMESHSVFLCQWIVPHQPKIPVKNKINMPINFVLREVWNLSFVIKGISHGVFRFNLQTINNTMLNFYSITKDVAGIFMNKHALNLHKFVLQLHTVQLLLFLYVNLVTSKCRIQRCEDLNYVQIWLSARTHVSLLIYVYCRVLCY